MMNTVVELGEYLKRAEKLLSEYELAKLVKILVDYWRHK
jgi:hypothetical protein